MLRNTANTKRLLKTVLGRGPTPKSLGVEAGKGTLAGQRDERRLNYEMHRQPLKVVTLDAARNRRVFHRRYQTETVKVAGFHGYAPLARVEYMRLWLEGAPHAK